MAIRHGKYSKFYVNSYDMSPYLNDVSTTQDVGSSETTTFGNTAKTYIVGLRDGKISAKGFFDNSSTSAVDSIFAGVLGLDDQVVTFVQDNMVIGSRAQVAQCDASTYAVNSPVADVVSATADFQVDGGVENGVVLAASRVMTSATTTNETGVDNTAATTNGGVAHLHVYANTWSGATTIKVQSSPDNTTWTDLVTFTAVTASTITTQRSSVAAGSSVPRYLRATTTTAAGTGSISFTVAFARRY